MRLNVNIIKLWYLSYLITQQWTHSEENIIKQFILANIQHFQVKIIV